MPEQKTRSSHSGAVGLLDDLSVVGEQLNGAIQRLQSVIQQIEGAGGKSTRSGRKPGSRSRSNGKR